jgi:hypothetical protein
VAAKDTTVAAPDSLGSRGLATEDGRDGKSGQRHGVPSRRHLGVRSALTSSGQPVDTLPNIRDAMDVDASGTRSVANALPRQVAVMSQPYWAGRPVMPM